MEDPFQDSEKGLEKLPKPDLDLLQGFLDAQDPMKKVRVSE